MKGRKNDTKELTRKAREIYHRTMEDISNSVVELGKDNSLIDAEAEYLLAEVVKNLTMELSTWVWEDFIEK